MLPDARPFGDASRPSASIMLVPVRDGAKVIGILSIHSYTPKAYDQHGLEILQALADHCAGALKRIGAQEALRESEANYRSLVELSPDAILLHSGERLVYVNPAALKLLRADDPQQLLGRSVFDLVPPENRETIRQRIQHAPERGMVPPLEQKILRLDGSGVDVEAISLPLIYEGKPAVQSIMRDITLRDATGAAVTPGAEDGGRRPACRGRRARLQQHARGHPRQCGIAAHGPEPAHCRHPGMPQADHRRLGTGGQPDPPVAGLQPQAGDAIPRRWCSTT